MKRLVLFKDGTVKKCVVCLYSGICLTGDPTAYVIRDGKLVWVVPGESVEFVEREIR